MNEKSCPNADCKDDLEIVGISGSGTIYKCHGCGKCWTISEYLDDEEKFYQ